MDGVIVPAEEEENQLFDKLMDRVGSSGKYQLYSQILWCSLCALSGCVSFFLPFLYEQGTYLCPSDYPGNCREYVCSLPQE